MDHRDDDGDQGQRDHDQQEREVPKTGRFWDADRHIAQDAGDTDEADDRQDPSECAADKDQQDERPDGIDRHPLAGQGEAQQHADDRHRQPESGPSPQPARPEGGEQRVRRDDEQPDVDVVHADPRLDEEHPVGDDEERQQAGHEPAPEEDPGEQVEQPGRQGTGDDAGEPPREGMGPDVDRGRRATPRKDQQLLAIHGRIVRLDVRGPGRRHESVGQARVGVDGVAMRLHDVDGPSGRRRARRRRRGASRRRGAARREPQDVDLLAGWVVNDLGAGCRERVTTKVRRPSLGAVAPDRDDLVPGIRSRAGRDVQFRVVEASHKRQAVGAATEWSRAHLRDAGRIDEGDAFARRDRYPGDVVDADARQPAVRDRRVERLARVAGPRAAEDDSAAR